MENKDESSFKVYANSVNHRLKDHLTMIKYLKEEVDALKVQLKDLEEVKFRLERLMNILKK